MYQSFTDAVVQIFLLHMTSILNTVRWLKYWCIGSSKHQTSFAAASGNAADGMLMSAHPLCTFCQQTLASYYAAWLPDDITQLWMCVNVACHMSKLTFSYEYRNFFMEVWTVWTPLVWHNNMWYDDIIWSVLATFWVIVSYRHCGCRWLPLCPHLYLLTETCVNHWWHHGYTTQLLPMHLL